MIKIIAFNWKQNPKTLSEAKKLFKILKKISKNTKKEIIIFPQLPFSHFILQDKQKGNLKIGVQNIFYKDDGAYTGEISPASVADLGFQYVLVGHSERREYFYEKDELIQKKVKASIKNNLNPIICIGEKTRDKKEKYKNFLEKQIKSSIKNLNKKNVKKIIFAYEPIWAIGVNAKRPITVDELEKTIDFIKNTLKKTLGENTAKQIKILYGGSVSSKNINDFKKVKNLSGFLIGGASLKAEEIKKIITFY